MICPLPMAVRLTSDLRPSVDGSAVRTSLVADQLQAASVPIAWAAAPHSQHAILGWDRQTDGRITVLLNTSLWRGHNK